MGRSSGSKELKAFVKQIERLGKDVPKIIDELAAQEGEVIAGMIKARTPWVTGHLRDNFHSYRDGGFSGNSVTITVANNVEYASYVERGHRLVNKDGKTIGWVQGRYMMRMSIRLYKNNKMKGNISRFIEKKLKQYTEN